MAGGTSVEQDIEFSTSSLLHDTINYRTGKVWLYCDQLITKKSAVDLGGHANNKLTASFSGLQR